MYVAIIQHGAASTGIHKNVRRMGAVESGDSSLLPSEVLRLENARLLAPLIPACEWISQQLSSPAMMA